MGSLPPFPRCISLTVPVLDCQTVCLICFPALEGVRPKPGPKFKRCGTIKPMVLVSDRLSNDISILQTKLSHREGHEARRIGLEAMPLDQHIEGGHGER